MNRLIIVLMLSFTSSIIAQIKTLNVNGKKYVSITSSGHTEISEVKPLTPSQKKAKDIQSAQRYKEYQTSVFENNDRLARIKIDKERKLNIYLNVTLPFFKEKLILLRDKMYIEFISHGYDSKKDNINTEISEEYLSSLGGIEIQFSKEYLEEEIKKKLLEIREEALRIIDIRVEQEIFERKIIDKAKADAEELKELEKL